MRLFQVKVAWSQNAQTGHQIIIFGEGEVAPFKGPGQIRVVII